ncbi:MAG: hypothetical protein ACLUTA_10015 [Blautia wexlerae]
MRFAENNRISHRQLYRQMILALLAPFMLCVFGKGGMNGISAVAGMIFCADIAWVLCNLADTADTFI